MEQSVEWMCWLSQLRFNLAKYALRQLMLGWFLLRMIDQLKDQSAYRSLEPPTDAEVLAVLDKLAVEFAKGVGRMLLRKGIETLLAEVEPLVGIVPFDLEFNRLCLLISSFDISLLPNLSRHQVLFFIV